ncbi:MAG: DEAD/DEAH box helicase, partial [Cyanobacteriota bacterium]|nr:DEAD/DEAH box helicase [Cyanobacteriota bacterium]
LQTTFRHSTHRFQGLTERFLADADNCFKGPYLSIALPFRRGGAGADYFPDVPLAFPPHRHQELAFERLKKPYYRSTLIATGTGSGKTECFLWPILAHCAQHWAEPGIKALLIYPMNALATDQAKRVAQAIHQNPKLKGRVTAGLFVGESERDPRAVMTEDGVITDKGILRHHPPDILLTNYKMLDYLLIRPGDQPLWAGNGPETLRYLVVDEIHTFDGAQGTDLACLIRRLKARLQTPEGHLACVGTSATLGGDAGKADLLDYAAGVFQEPFGAEAIVEEDRLTPDEFLQEIIRESGAGQTLSQTDLIDFFLEIGSQSRPLPTLADLATLDPANYESRGAYLDAQHRLWFGEPIPGPPESPAWRLALGQRQGLISLRIAMILLPLLASGPLTLAALWEKLGRKFPLPENAPPAFRTAFLDSLLALMASARRLPASAEPGGSAPMLPWVNLRVQFWIRELRRMAATVEAEPRLVFADDRGADHTPKILPVLNCRDCGATAWGGLRPLAGADQIRGDLKDFYIAYFGEDPRITFLFPQEDSTEPKWEPGWKPWNFCPQCLSLNRRGDKTCRACGGEDLLAVVEPNLIREEETPQGEARLVSGRDCPVCGASEGLSILGSRAASLSSVVIGSLFGSPYNDHRKLIAFSDSVQDAAHRAGFFSARTFRNTLRAALAQYLERQGDGLSLEQIIPGFQEYWRTQLGSEADYIATFMPTDMQWLGEWEALLNTGKAAPNLSDWIDQRLSWEITAEAGLIATVGRSLERAGVCAFALSPSRLQAAVETLLPQLQNEVGALSALAPETLTRFLLGLLRHLRQQGGVLHPEALRYIQNNGKTYVLQQPLFMPGFGARAPIYLTDKANAFERVLRQGRRTWCYRWAFKSLFDWSELSLIGEQFDLIYDLTLTALVNQQLLELRHTGNHHRVWGLPPSALHFQTANTPLECDTCGDPHLAPREEAPLWIDSPCLKPHCAGSYRRSAGDRLKFYKNLYTRGEVWRVFAREHTGLLPRDAREQLEDRFINGARRSDPNLLSATSTLEMGINIGDLSSALLCSAPPTQANYQQRIGRAGRRDGNAFIGAIANGRPHDLYFWADPLKMIAGGVETPGFYLDASAILQRQLTAYCLDCWVAQGARPQDLPERFSQALEAVKAGDTARFPYNWLSYIETRQSELLAGFIRLFADRIAAETQQQLTRFMEKGDFEAGGLRWRILNRLREVVEERSRLQSQIELLRRRLKEKESGPKSQNHEEELEELRRERAAFMDLVKKLNNKNTLNFFTDEGLLPNYAFPEAGVTLKSIIWRERRVKGDADQGKYETFTFEYERPSRIAISELVPSGTFYAEGRRVNIDQIDLNLSRIEEWRFCRDCAYAVSTLEEAARQKTCPRCGDAMWADEGRKRRMVRLRQVMAASADRGSRIGDDRDERTPSFFTKSLLADFEPSAREETYVFADEEFPFGFEFIKTAAFREVNFGEASAQGEKVEIAGENRPRHGFKVCRHCGKVQTSKNKNKFKHALSCGAKNKDDESQYVDILYLFRQFESEAIRILAPVDLLNFPEKLHSLIAALQLGLKLHFRGNVDHLSVLISEEPQPNRSLRRPYLFLYDTVPGGTGYLKQLVRNPEDLMAALEKALAVVEHCQCEDGCYQCLFAYRNSADRDRTRRTVAVSLLKAILSRKHTLKRSETSLSGVKLNALFDSVLEQRFIEALRRYRYREEPTIVRQEIIRGKAGYFVKIGEQAWNVEPQAELGPPQGVAVPSRADFVFWPATNAGQLKPVVVFTDGWEYHRERLGLDFLQRLAISQSGRFRVWSLTWVDVDSQFNPQEQNGVNLLELNVNEAFRRNGLKFSEQYGCASLHPLASESSFVWLTHYLANPDDAQWLGFALVRTGAGLDPALKPGQGWGDEARALLGDTLMALAQADDPERRWGRFEWPAKDGVPLIKGYLSVDLTRHRQKDPDSVFYLLWLDDRDSPSEEPALLQAWQGAARLFNLCQFLPRAWVLTERSAAQSLPELETLLTDSLSRPALQPQSEMREDWRSIFRLADKTVYSLLEQMAQRDLPLPEVGYELEDEDGGALTVPAELAWPESQIALFLQETDWSGFTDQGWSAYTLTTVQADPESFFQQLPIPREATPC